MTFDLNDKRALLAAEGWLELDLPREASAELAKITPQLRGHPDVLEIRWHIGAKEKQWETCVEIAAAVVTLAPERFDGWIHRSFALHELHRTQAAFDQLLPVADKFPGVWTIPYNLACYASQLQHFEPAQRWLNQAIAIGGKKVREAAAADPDLKPLWDSLGGPSGSASREAKS